MFKRLFKKLNEDKVRESDEYDVRLTNRIKDNIEAIKKVVGESDDVVQRDLLVGKKTRATLFFIDGLVSNQRIEDMLLRPLVNDKETEMDNLSAAMTRDITYIIKKVTMVNDVSVTDTLDAAVLGILSGDTILIIDGYEQLLLFDTREFKQRAIEEPKSEIVVNGPRDGFIESLKTNIVLIRKRVRDPNLVVQMGQLGRRAKHDFSILYIKGVVNEQLVDEVRYRISCVDTDDIGETGVLQEYIEDNTLSLFPQLLRTERPDKTVRSLLDGKVVVLLDGAPLSLIMPITLNDLFKSPEDNYDRWQIASMIRLLRYIAAFIALFLPALYVAMVSFHQGMIPTTLALSIAGTREGVPFPSFIEALLMAFTIELLREAGVRLPRPVGQTIGIVGGLVIGDAAVRAGIVSPIMVIVIALTAISSFSTPDYNAAITFRMLRVVVMISAAIFGLFGIVTVYIAINIHLVGLRSFGSYYTSPFAPYHFPSWLDMFIRAPLILQRERKAELHPLDSERQR